MKVKVKEGTLVFKPVVIEITLETWTDLRNAVIELGQTTGDALQELYGVLHDLSKSYNHISGG